jgi:hypothetical protein
MINYNVYADPDFGLLLPTALVLPSLGINEYTLRKFRPLLEENVDFLKQRREDHIDRIFYSVFGLLKLADVIATPVAVKFKETIQAFLPKSTQVSAQPASIVPAPTQAMQPFEVPQSSLHPFTPAQRALARPLAVPAEQMQPAPYSETYKENPHKEHSDEPAPAFSSQSNPASAIAGQIAPYLVPVMTAQVAHLESKVEAALDRLANRPQEVVQAELLLRQQEITLKQFQSTVEYLLQAQQMGVSNALNLIQGAPEKSTTIRETRYESSHSHGLEDLFKILNSRGFGYIVGFGAFVIAALIFFGLGNRSSSPVSPPISTPAPSPAMPPPQPQAPPPPSYSYPPQAPVYPQQPVPSYATPPQPAP